MPSSDVKLDYQYFDPAGVKVSNNPIVFLHAMLCSKEIWTTIPQTVANGTRRRVYTYDARNHGVSTHTENSNFDNNVDDLFNFIDQLKSATKAEKFVLVGHDMGGVTAIRAALRMFTNFEKVIIVEMYPRRLPNHIIDRTKNFVIQWTNCIQELPKETPVDDLTKISVENLYKKLDFLDQLEKESYQKGEFLYKPTDKGYEPHYNTTALIKALGSLKEDPEDYLGSFHEPSYFFYGTESHYKILDQEKCIKYKFPNAELVPFDGASHFFVADRPAELAKEIIKCVIKDS